MALVSGAVVAVQAVTEALAPTTPVATATNPQGPPTSRAATTTPGGAPGPGADEPGIRLRAMPGADGDVEVAEQIRLLAPSTRLRLGPTPVTRIPGSEGLRPVLHRIQAAADGQVIAVPSADALDRPVEITFKQPVTAIALSYRLSGAAQRSQPAPPGRAIIHLAPAVTVPGGPLVVIEVSGVRVRNVVCPLLPADLQLCGREDGQVWSTPPIPSSQAAVLVQVDLPEPSAARPIS